MVIACLVWLLCLDISFLHFTFHGKYYSLLFFEFELNLNYSKWLCQWCISQNIFAEDICPDCLIYAGSLYYDAVNVAEPTNLYQHKYNGSPQAVTLSYLSLYKPSSPHYRTPGVCRVPETLGKIHKTLGKLFAECNTRRIALAINSSGKANFVECHLSGTRQTFCRVQFGSRRKEMVITPDPPLTVTSPSVKRQSTRQLFFLKYFWFLEFLVAECYSR